MSAYLLDFLDERKIFVTTESVFIKYIGSRLILEPRDSPSGTPQGIILPRLLNQVGPSERSNRFTVDFAPRPDMKKSKLNSLPASETERGEWSDNFTFSDSISFRDEGELLEYTNGICRAMLDLVQGFLDTLEKPDKAITLFMK